MAHNHWPMWNYYCSLFKDCWEAFRASLGTTSLGFVAPLIVSVLSIAITLFIVLKKQGKEAMLKRWREDAAIALRVTLVVTAVVYVPIFVWSSIHTIYGQHESLAVQVKNLEQKNKALELDLELHRHGMVTGDPVFPNTIYLLEAFRMYRVALGYDAKCTIYVTAPPEADAIASMTAQFQINVSNCATFGPMGTDLPPSMQKEALEGSTPGFVTINAPENDRAADELMNRLNSVFRVKRGYREIPRGRLAEYPRSNAIWIQFGSQSAFASELRERGK